MRWRRPRLTIRVIMCVILVAGVLLGGGIYARGLVQRSAQYRRVAVKLGSAESMYRSVIPTQQQSVRSMEGIVASATELARTYHQQDHFFAGRTEREARAWNRVAAWKKDLQDAVRRLERYKALADHYAALKQKYEYAASHPWLTVPADPPEPRHPADPPKPTPAPKPAPAPSRPGDQRWFLTRIDGHLIRQAIRVFALLDSPRRAIIPE